MQIRGYRLLVKAEEIKRETDWGFVTSVEGTNEDRMEQSGNQIGFVVGVGHTCWKGGVDETPWCKEGDRILYSKHAGRFVYDPNTDEPYLVINDDDVLLVLEKKVEE